MYGSTVSGRIAAAQAGAMNTLQNPALWIVMQFQSTMSRITFCAMTVSARILALATILALAAPFSCAEEGGDGPSIIDLTLEDNRSIDLAQFQWINRLLVIFADTGNDPRLVEQMELIRGQSDQLDERDVIVLLDTDPTLKSRLRERMRPRGFAIVLVGKDGQIRLRKPFPWSVREISRAIDKSPLRQRELRQGG